ncbi:stage II sporulation protein M [bacterium]|nr:stage II sporulation protein M [bacterium]
MTPRPAEPIAPRRGAARADLQRFAALVERAERLRVRGVGFDELRELAALYRTHVARLAVARDRDADPDAVRTLNGLCARAYAALFSERAARTRRPWSQALRAALGQTWRAQVIAWALLAAGMLLGGGLTWHDPLAVHALVPSGMGYSPDQLDALLASATARERFFAAHAMPAGLKAVFGSFLFANNTRVGLLAFATGMLAGIPTLLLTLYNGILLGAFASIFLHDPWPLAFLAWILPHGVPELTAISLCAAGGLQLGAAVAMPGPRGRAAALADAVPPVLVLLGAALPLFVVAALIESFVRQSALGTAPRLAVAALWIAAAVALVVAARRAAPPHAADTSWLRDLT